MSALTLNDSRHPPASPSLRQYRELLSRYLKPQMKWVILMAVVLLAEIAIKLINPQVLRYFLDTAQAGNAARSLQMAAILFLIFAILQEVMSLGTRYTAARVGWSSTNRLRADLTLHLLRLDMPFHKLRTPGELIDRADGDVTYLSNFLSMFTVNVIGNGLLLLGILVMLFRENTWVGLGILTYTLLTLLVLRSIQKLAVPRWAAERQASARLYGFIEERISGAEEIRAAGAESYVMRRLYEHMRDFTHKTRAAVVFSSLTYNLTNLVYVLGYAAGLAIGVILYMRGEASLGTAYLITYYVGMLSDPLQSIRGQAQDFQQAAANIRRINELFNLRPQVGGPLYKDTNLQEILPRGPLSVSFQKVSFQYDDNQDSRARSLNEGESVDEDERLGQAKALSGISFEIQPGRVLGILGRT